jgi:uncharacterized membrane protein YeaQ/YmgE (transglycosylase-associated protein family)
MWSIMAYIALGMLAGWLASWFIRGDRHPRDWGMLFIVGVGGSVAGGIVVNLLMGNGFKLVPGGVISSVAFACLFLWIVTMVRNRGKVAAHATASGTHRQPKGGHKHQHKH